MKKLFAFLALVGLAAGLQAATVTNQGQVITVTKLNETADAGTVVEDQSVYAKSGDRRGMIVAECKITSSTTGTNEFSLENVPKGAILLEDAVIEVATAVTPATSTNAIIVGGVTVLAEGVTLGSTGIKAAVANPGITTAAGKVSLVVTGSAATNGNFTVFLPYVQGNAGR